MFVTVFVTFLGNAWTNLEQFPCVWIVSQSELWTKKWGVFLPCFYIIERLVSLQYVLICFILRSLFIMTCDRARWFQFSHKNRIQLWWKKGKYPKYLSRYILVGVGGRNGSPYPFKLIKRSIKNVKCSFKNPGENP